MAETDGRVLVVDVGEHATTLELLDRLVERTAGEQRRELAASRLLIERLLSVSDEASAQGLLLELFADARHG